MMVAWPAEVVRNGPILDIFWRKSHHDLVIDWSGIWEGLIKGNERFGLNDFASCAIC